MESEHAQHHANLRPRWLRLCQDAITPSNQAMIDACVPQEVSA